MQRLMSSRAIRTIKNNVIDQSLLHKERQIILMGIW